jgi:8-oxo-dGTP pyrophosphatase MutT (NUDIX family)
MLIKNPLVRWSVQRAMRWQRGMTLGVRVIVIDDQERVLLVRHGYAPGWHFPGGGVDPGESIQTAAIRELLEEAGVEPTTPLQLFGLYANFAAFPGDHIAVFVVRQFVRRAVPAASYEIREQGFFALEALPDKTTAGTRRRLSEVFDAEAPAQVW